MYPKRTGTQEPSEEYLRQTDPSQSVVLTFPKTYSTSVDQGFSLNLCIFPFVTSPPHKSRVAGGKKCFPLGVTTFTGINCHWIPV